jgi:DGQHR domain-containing protein
MATKIRSAAPSFVEYHALKGSYGKVSYFVTKTTLRDVAENLMLAPSDTLSFTERIQREINEKRVDTEILPYLRQNDLRFFNALVCVLLPDNDQVQGFWGFEEFTDDSGSPLGGLGKLKITKRVGRVVLDGQHRFLALKKFWEQVRHEPTGEDAQVEVALIFVVVEDLGRLGSKGIKLREKTILVARNLFAVLNKTARSVDKTTLLLIDDTDIANVMTRRLIEDGLLDDRLIKWTKALNLGPGDPYFTVIHVLKDAIEHFLRDRRDELGRDYGIEDERKAAIADLYSTPAQGALATETVIPRIVQRSAPYVNWTELLKKSKLRVLRQPEDTPLGKEEKRRLAEVRNQEIAYTVAGQKAFYRAIIDCYRAQPKANAAALDLAILRANTVFARGYYQRIPKKTNPFLGVLIDAKGRMYFSESAVDCGRQILGVAIGSKSNKDAVLEEYKTLTNLDPEPVLAFWKSTSTLRR